MGACPHDLLVRIGLRFPSCYTFEVTAARLACDDNHIRCTVNEVSRPVLSCMLGG